MGISLVLSSTSHRRVTFLARGKIQTDITVCTYLAGKPDMNAL